VAPTAKKRPASPSPETRPAPPPETPIARVKTKINPQDGLAYVWIPPGSFTMGCSSGDPACRPNEQPAHQVTITKGFWIGKTEVTQAAFERVSGRNPSSFRGANLPVESLMWRQAHMYCGTVGMRLPTEAEWEYAARGNSAEPRYGSPTEIAWLSSNSEETTHEVGQKEPNGFGLYDMLGNVGEWTADWYGEYSDTAVSDPRGPAEGEYHILRGGYWSLGVFGIRASHRLTRFPGQRGPHVGFRCAGD
jgi:formylglycine-generating enzyme required for sulfatase activity